MNALQISAVTRPMKDLLYRAVRKVRGSTPPPPQDTWLLDNYDPTTDWLSYANAGMLHVGNRYCFDYAISHLPSHAPIVEIGSFCGLSTNFLTYYKKRHGRENKIFNCDRWEFENTDKSSPLDELAITHAEYRAFVKDTYTRNVEFFSRLDRPHTIEMFSDEFFSAWRDKSESTDIFGRQVQLGGPISFCYIDGNHSYEFAKRDFQNCDEFLEPAGFILFDDSADDSPFEVNRVIEEIKSSGGYEVVVKNPNYLLRKL